MIIDELGEKTINDLDRMVKEYFLESFKESKQTALRNLGFLEFKKHRTPPDSPEEKIMENKDLDSFIAFLDKGYKEWKDSRDKKE